MCGYSANRHVLKEEVLYSLIRNEAFCEHGAQHGRDLAAAGWLQTKENMGNIMLFLRAGGLSCLVDTDTSRT